MCSLLFILSRQSLFRIVSFLPFLSFLLDPKNNR